ncbi:MAG: D-alanyl-D-alanine carboxypeptidase/D-alanyl-D-alanine-endopeptidase [Ideonella sp.]
MRATLLLTMVLASTALPAQEVSSLPPEVIGALRAADISPTDMVAVIQEAGSDMARAPRLAWQVHRPMNPASLMKLFPTVAALELLGPAWQWSTPVWLSGSLPAPPTTSAPADGIYDGNITIRGSGDPTLSTERLWLLLRQLWQLGVRDIRGDIVFDRSAFADSAAAPGDFDDAPLRPYNVQADALLLNQKVMFLGFEPDPALRIARVTLEPALDGVHVPLSVALSDQPCADWRAALQADFSNPTAPHFNGAFPAACGSKRWAVAHPDFQGFNGRLLVGMWREMGGRFSGRVRDGVAPGTQPSFELHSPPLAEVVRGINKFSNNVMAQQLFLSLPLALYGDGSVATARQSLREWVRGWLGDEETAALVIDNGSGLSRDNRVSALAFARLLMRAWAGSTMSELVSSLPVSGLDGTLRRSTLPAGRAHLKTGSLRDVAGIAGYVLADNGRRYVVVAIINHPNANRARAALDQIAQWALHTASH